MYSNSRHPGFAVALMLLALLVFAPLSADAWWFKKDKPKPPEIENFEPPAEDAFVSQCEPIRQQVVDLNNHTPRLLRIFIIPRREYLQHKHRRCKAKVMDQEFQYLKHVDIKNPTLPAIPTELQAPPKPVEETPNKEIPDQKTETQQDE